MGKGGGRPAPPPQPSPEEIARAQMKVQEEARLKREAGWASDASQFAAANPITEDWRADILGRGRGLGSSAGRYDQASEAQGLGQASRADIMAGATQRADTFGADRQRFLDTATRNIRGGQSVESATAQYKTDLATANSAFERQLREAPSMDQRNQAYKDFELGRGVASQRFSDAMASLESDALMASAATFGQTRGDKRLEQGQTLFGGGGGQSTPLG